MYYLQSRYYDPEIGRFLNADNLVSTGQGLLGNNMFVYCLNCPVIYCDYGGNSADVIALAPDAYNAFMLFLAGIASSNSWNMIGWIAAAVLATGVVTAGALVLYEWFISEQETAAAATKSNGKSVSTESKKQNNKSGNSQNSKNRHTTTSIDPNYRGGTTYNKNGIRIDYEYYGNGNGNVHMHLNNVKYYYNVETGLFHHWDGTLAGESIQAILSIPKILDAIMKALKFIVG